ncbi:MAG TPA: glycosyltransferase family 1 protein [Chloroflexia bacterium]|nr:glycosyltransferase family 1 protein [Chloroflexia bacterium]
MRIGVDASRLAVGHRTGTENYAFQLIRGLVSLAGESQKQNLTLYFNQPPSAAVLDELKLNPAVETRSIPFPRLWTHLRLSREMLQHAPDRLFVPAHVLPLYHPSYSIVTVHDLGYLYFPAAHTAASRLYLDLSTRFSATQARRVIAVSQATKNDLVRHYGIKPEKIEVIYHGYDAERYRPIEDQEERRVARSTYGIGPGRFLLYIGTIQPRKNLLRLLEAFQALIRDPQFEDVQLVLGGKAGWLSEPILNKAAEIQASQPGRVLLPGYLDDKHLPALLSEASAFVFPSLYEGFGMPVLEALACGCPVVCSNSSSLPEVAGEAALYHHPLDTLALEERLRQVLTMPELVAELRCKGLAQAARFSWEACALQTWQVLTSGDK